MGKVTIRFTKLLLKNGDITHYHYNLQGQIIGESQYNSTGTLQHNISYIWLNNKPVAQINTSNVPSSLNQNDISYIHFDHLNTPRLATNSAKTIIWSWHSEAFGSTLANADPDNNSIETHINLRFPGQYYDDETGLHYNYYRYYDSVTGRYVTSDPIGLEGGVNTFAYVEGNPVGAVDPLGLDATNWMNTSGGRSVFDGPTNGNWGGKNWSGGQNSSGNNMGNASPIDSADACYKSHDQFYSAGTAKVKCDTILVNDLLKLSNDPKYWPSPPKPGTEKDSANYGDAAIFYFK